MLSRILAVSLLFGRFNLKSDAPPEQTIDKLNSSIIIYSEIYGPENVGLTPQYFYLAEYFLVTIFKFFEKIFDFEVFEMIYEIIKIFHFFVSKNRS